MIKVDIHDWIGLNDEFTKQYGLPDYIKRAIAIEIERIASEASKRRLEQKLEAQQQVKPYLEALQASPKSSSIDRTFK